MSLFDPSPETQDRLIRAVCLLAATLSMGLRDGHTPGDVVKRARTFQGYVKDDRDE